MPLLLTQPNGIRRSTWFLLGSVLGIITLGVVRDRRRPHHAAPDDRLPVVGAGHRDRVRRVVRRVWLLPLVAPAARRCRTGGVRQSAAAAEPQRWKLFGFGAGLVVVQSLLDVVFIVAMINVGARNLPALEVLIAVVVYGRGADLQIAIVAAYAMAGPQRRTVVADAVTGWLDRHGTTTAVIAAIGGRGSGSKRRERPNGGPSLGEPGARGRAKATVRRLGWTGLRAVVSALRGRGVGWLVR